MLLARLSQAVVALPEAAELAQGAKLDDTRRAALLATARAALAGTGDGDA